MFRCVAHLDRRSRRPKKDLGMEKKPKPNRPGQEAEKAQCSLHRRHEDARRPSSRDMPWLLFRRNRSQRNSASRTRVPHWPCRRRRKTHSSYASSAPFPVSASASRAIFSATAIAIQVLRGIFIAPRFRRPSICSTVCAGSRKFMRQSSFISFDMAPIWRLSSESVNYNRY